MELHTHTSGKDSSPKSSQKASFVTLMLPEQIICDPKAPKSSFVTKKLAEQEYNFAISRFSPLTNC